MLFRSGGGGGGGDINGDLPPTREVRAGGKRFYFDVATNDRGTFIKLSEVRGNDQVCYWRGWFVERNIV